MEYPKIHMMEQGGNEWHAIRDGKVTASRFKDAMAGGKGASKKTLLYELSAEIDKVPGGEAEESYSNGYMEWGIETEAAARLAYEARNSTNAAKCVVEQVGFIEYSKHIGGSPDGLVGDDGIIEIKCPKSSTHARYRHENRPVAAYMKQIQGLLWITGRKWCDFISFDPRSKHSFWSIRIPRDEKLIAKIDTEVNAFVQYVLDEIEKTNKSPF